MPAYDEDTINAFIDWLYKDRGLVICDYGDVDDRFLPVGQTDQLANAFLRERL